MAAPQTKTVVIICPHCTTRYQVPAETVGPKGRQVQCAHCSKTWQAFAEKIIELEPPKVVAPALVKIAPPAKDADRMFDAAAEAELDAAFEAEQKAAAAKAAGQEVPEPETVVPIEDITAAIAPKVSEAAAPDKPPASPADKKRQKAFQDRQHNLIQQLPLARVRRILRVTGLVTLATLISCGYSFRTDIVRLFPDLAGTYEALGMGVNVVGLEFRDVKTLLAIRKGADVIQVDARIYSVAPGKVMVPPVVVTLLNDEGLALYEWSVAPDVPELVSGEVVDFSTQVSAPPSGATKVRLTFGSGRLQVPQPQAAVATVPSSAEIPVTAAAPAAPAHSEEPAH